MARSSRWGLRPEAWSLGLVLVLGAVCASARHQPSCCAPTHLRTHPLPLWALKNSVLQAVYTTLREAEYRSTYPIAYWNIAPLRCAGSLLAPAVVLGCSIACSGPAGLGCWISCAGGCWDPPRRELACAPWLESCNTPKPRLASNCVACLSSPALTLPCPDPAPCRYLVPRQRRNQEALNVISDTLDELIAKCKRLVSR
jgi:hypothetical protein